MPFLSILHKAWGGTIRHLVVLFSIMKFKTYYSKWSFDPAVEVFFLYPPPTPTKNKKKVAIVFVFLIFVFFLLKSLVTF